MDDDKRRDVRQFEPPPWERDAFEALARKKAEEQAALDLLAALSPSVKEPAELQAEAMAAEVLAAKAVAAQAAVATAGVHDPAIAPATKPVAAASVDERQVQAMLLELSREETTDTGHIRLIARIAAVITAAVGTGMLAGGLMTLGGSQDAAKRTLATTMASGALSVFGLCFVAIAAWVWIRSNRVKGSR
jgi:hypothetical protein